MHSFRSVTSLAVALLASSSTLASAQTIGALGLEDVVASLSVAGAREVLPRMVRESCVTFPLDNAATSRLRSAGADENLLNAIRTACFTGAELVVTSQPTGAQVLVGRQAVGTTPLTVRYLPGQTVELAAVSRGRTLTYSSVPLRARQRTRAFLSFAEDTAAIPRIRSAVEVGQQSRLDQRWTPTVPEPGVPSSSLGFLPLNGLLAAGFLSGRQYCGSANATCFIETEVDPSTGEDISTGDRKVVGGLMGMGAGLLTFIVADRLWKGRHNRAVARRAEWQQSNERARTLWMQQHPEALRGVAADRAARQRVIEANARIKARNAALPPSSLTTETIAGPAN